MSAYMFRWYALRAQLWEAGHVDYNHLWAEPFLNTTLILHGVNVLRDPMVRGGRAPPRAADLGAVCRKP